MSRCDRRVGRTYLFELFDFVGGQDLTATTVDDSLTREKGHEEIIAGIDRGEGVIARIGDGFAGDDAG
jgi:hypothetical protein